MSIILEGVNGTGKTTFAHNWMLLNPEYLYISNDISISQSSNKYIKSECSKEILFTESERPFILDRSFLISEYIYSLVLGRESYITIENVLDYIDRLNTLKHSISFFTYKNPEDHFKSQDSKFPLASIDARYKELFSQIPKFERFDIRYMD